jgi:hypothetical protein
MPSPYEAWDADKKDEFDMSFQFMVCVSVFVRVSTSTFLTRIVHTEF